MKSIPLTVALGVAGFLAAAGIGIAANAITGDSVGLSAEPLAAGEDLAPAAASRTREEADRAEERARAKKRRERARERARERREERAAGRSDAPSTPATPAPAPTDDVDGDDNSGSGSDSSGSGSGDDSGQGRGRGRGRGGDD